MPPTRYRDPKSGQRAALHHKSGFDWKTKRHGVGALLRCLELWGSINRLQASISRSDLRNPEPERGLGFAPPGKIDALVEMAVRAAIDLYYRELESRGAN